MKPLKSEGAKKCNIKKYKASELESLLGAGKVRPKEALHRHRRDPCPRRPPPAVHLRDAHGQFGRRAAVPVAGEGQGRRAPSTSSSRRCPRRSSSSTRSCRSRSTSRTASTTKRSRTSARRAARTPSTASRCAPSRCGGRASQPGPFSSCPSGLLSRRARAARRLSRRRFCRRPTPRFRPTASLDSSAGCRCWSRAGRRFVDKVLGPHPTPSRAAGVSCDER